MRSRRLAVGGVGLLLVSGVAWWLGARSQSPDQAAARASEPEASWITAGVVLRELAATVVVRGDVVPEGSVGVVQPVSVEGDGVVTRLPAEVGSVVEEGSVVVEVSGRPVFVVAGEVPVFRSLSPGMVGDDVLQLQQGLVRLGLSPEVDGVFGEATKRAVDELYRGAGYEPVASSVTAAQVAEAQQAVDAAGAEVVAAEVAVDAAVVAAGGSGLVAAQLAVAAAERAVWEALITRDGDVRVADLAVGAAQARVVEVAADPLATQPDRDEAAAALIEAQIARDAVVRRGDGAVVSAEEALRLARVQLREAGRGDGVDAAQRQLDVARAARDAAVGRLWGLSLASGPTVPRGEVVFVPAGVVRVQSAVGSLGSVGGNTDAGGGAGGSGGGELVRLAVGGLQVVSSVRAGDDGLVRVGMTAELLDELSGEVYAAEVTSLADSVSVDASGVAGRAMVLTPVDALPDSMASVNVRVTFTAASSEGAVLVVPLAAVSSGADGSTRVTVLADGSDDPVDVPVVAGLSADGFIAVEPVTAGALSVGDLVVVGR
jgi:peptidoglycan hydrolase-like protein with peptidoglycan-binding domain